MTSASRESRLECPSASTKIAPHAPISRRLHRETRRPRSLSQPAQAGPGRDGRRRVKAVDGLGREERRVDPDRGGMVGKTTRVTKDGIAGTVAPFCGYIVVEAETIEAAARLFENHPHSSVFPGDGVDIMPFLTEPAS